ncbi:hypothetical protein C0Q70_20196 [Pomacea canaliculata]|uniref:MADS-box domain-containing protein n=2 Tax=Pomacea canaliculata TaxID=400727 RepID=A0A2T7NEY4_POMCA|nr:myocyte-specific enhancer factor 2A-like isoform X2 [Pomacea canaliculata]XP_025076658.1 myocyte-specific enhancer factor 2A-like isoform X2 [Pomacea canaliculata]PVD19705.1 hypothetical protein C0Q70_20196 [Pomacea canaliculata]
MKKAYELSVLCDCEIALIIFNGSNKLFQYASTDMDKVLLKYTEYNEPHESRTNKDIIEALNKKEHKGCESPEPVEQEPYVSGLRCEEKFDHLSTDEYQRIMQQNAASMRGPPSSPYGSPNLQMSVGGLSSHPSIYQSQGTLLSPSPQNHSLSPSPGLLQPPQVVSPRPHSAGGVVDLNHSPVPTPNGYQHRISPCSSPGVVPCAKPMHRGSPVPLPTSPVPQGAVVSSSQQLRPNPSLRIVPPAMRSDHASESQRRSPNPSAAPTNLMTGNINYPSSISTSFPANNFCLSNSDLSAGGLMFGSWGGHNQSSLGSPMSHSQSAMGHHSPVEQSISLSSHSSPMGVNILSGIHIKSEPITPPRESTTPSGPMPHHIQQQQPQQQLRPSSGGNGTGHLSPGHAMSHSDSSSPVSVHALDYESPAVKRSRIEAWTT